MIQVHFYFRCPIEPAIFPALKKSEDSKSLVAPFQAFKFASESTVKFQLTVSFCLDVCTPVSFLLLSAFTFIFHQKLDGCRVSLKYVRIFHRSQSDVVLSSVFVGIFVLSNVLFPLLFLCGDAD